MLIFDSMICSSKNFKCWEKTFHAQSGEKYFIQYNLNTWEDWSYVCGVVSILIDLFKWSDQMGIREDFYVVPGFMIENIQQVFAFI